MSFCQDFLKAASHCGLKPRFSPSFDYSWPQAKITSKLQFFMASKKISFKLKVFKASSQDF
jgi:hypothetical protein